MPDHLSASSTPTGEQAASRTGFRRSGPRRRLRSVLTQAGPAPARGPGNPLALGRDARARLSGAVHALLDTAGLDGAGDAVRLAAVVLAAKTPWATGAVEIRTSELGRWLGLSASYLASHVVPALRRSGVVTIETAPGEIGQDNGLKCRVLPLWEARGTVGHPLALRRTEIATLLRLLEAVMAPGWAHRDGSVTPAGLLGDRTGRGAATDRLALLLLMLEATRTGRVRQCGGTVDTRRGRAAATVARLLGCTASAGERILERLESRDLVRRVRAQTASGLAHRTRLVVPAVAAAHGRDSNPGGRGVRTDAPEPGFSEPDGTARHSDASEPVETPQVRNGLGSDGTEKSEPDATAALHTDHTPVAPPATLQQLSCGLSGDSRGQIPGRPERGRAREDQAADGAEQMSPVSKAGPLRGENPTKFPADEQERRDVTGAAEDVRLKTLGGGKAQQQGPRPLGDLRVRIALAPVTGLWSRLTAAQRAIALRAADQALHVLSGIVGPEAAPQVLAHRLADRLQETGGEALVREPMGWLLGRGLVQRPACPDPRCDDSIRLDTGTDCPSCANIAHIRRMLRTRIAAQVGSQMPCSDPATCRAETERRLREETALEEQRAQIRRTHAEREIEQRQQALARRRALEQEAELVRRQAPCVDCGLPEAAGLCPACSSRRRTEELVREAVDLAVAVRADLSDATEVTELTHQCEKDTRVLLAAACEQACGPDADPALVAFTAPKVARRIRDERRAAALRRLQRSAAAMAESDAVHGACLRRRGQGAEAAAQAADTAGRRTAEFLLGQLLDELGAARQSTAKASVGAA